MIFIIIFLIIIYFIIKYKNKLFIIDHFINDNYYSNTWYGSYYLNNKKKLKKLFINNNSNNINNHKDFDDNYFDYRTLNNKNDINIKPDNNIKNLLNYPIIDNNEYNNDNNNDNNNNNDKTIQEIYDKSIKSYKIHNKNINNNNNIIEGASNLSYFNSNQWNYDNEEIMNGGKITDELYSYDELTNNAIFN
jgi:hypothetical protein